MTYEALDGLKPSQIEYTLKIIMTANFRRKSENFARITQLTHFFSF